MARDTLSKEEKKQRRKRRKLITGIILLILILAGLFLFHPLMSRHNLNMLAENGYYDPVSVGDHSLNLLKYGNENSGRRIVALSGFGVGDSCVSMRKMTVELEKENQLIFLDRAGYGASDDTRQNMTVSMIVEDYRTALRNAGVQAPYTLMAHSIAGIYASYWGSMYPDEIDGVILLDATWILPENAEDDVTPIVLRQRAMHIAAKIGVFDLGPSTFDGTKEEKQISRALTSMTNDSKALLSEAKLQPANVKAALDVLAPNDIPKLYIQCGKVFPEEAKKNLQRYTDQLGNCRIELLDSSHQMYLDNPEECCRIIQDYLAAE